MNDKLKFRVFGLCCNSKLEKNWVNITEVGNFLIDKDGNLMDASAYFDPINHPEHFIIEQCTGLSDKNGNLIYEGDCVGFYVYGVDNEWHAQQGTVIWYNSCWGVETSSRFIQFENELTIKNPKDIEIIGNVHEQAEQKDK